MGSCHGLPRRGRGPVNVQPATAVSSQEDSEWTLTHRWLREPGIARIRLRFLDDSTYEQEVAEVVVDGTLTPESSAVLKRERTKP
jgi:hypothetical protein